MIRKKDLLKRIEELENKVFGISRYGETPCNGLCFETQVNKVSIKNIEDKLYGRHDDPVISIFDMITKLEDGYAKLQRDHDQLVKAVEPIIAKEVGQTLGDIFSDLDKAFKDLFGETKTKKKPTATNKTTATEKKPTKKGGK